MYIPGEGILSVGDFIDSLPEIVQSTELITAKKNLEYYNIPSAFDIETTSFYQDGIEKKENRRAIMYCWAYGIGNIITFGRKWEEFILLNKIVACTFGLSENRRLITYVHNLPYEFQFMRKWIKWNKIFLMDRRKPVYALSNDGIEYRCSLKLSGGKSLEEAAKDIVTYPIKKMVGDLDYSVLRTPETPMTPKELKYVENDVRVLLHYIQEKIETDGNITAIPLTNTGYVRNYCREACYGKTREEKKERWHKYRRLMNSLTVKPEEYSQLKDAFQGGFTHANPRYVGKVIGNVDSYDFTSSYPAVMVLEKFPMSVAKVYDKPISEEEFKDLLMTKCCMFDVEFKELRPKLFQDSPISASKCKELEEAVYAEAGSKEEIPLNNGRVAYASRLKTTITEQDFMTYCAFYDWEEYKISNLRTYEKDYLPTPLVRAILDLYLKKTKLKARLKNKEEIPQEELLSLLVTYNVVKGMLNANYGMTVTDIVRDEYLYENDIFLPPQEPNLIDAIDKYNKNVKRFLFYPWGVWVTAYARANLFSGIIALGQDYIYSDTDSVKFKNYAAHKDYFKAYNEQNMRKIQKAAAFHKIDPVDFSPLDLPIGAWDDDGHYKRFKTLGAKRYLTQGSDGYTLTVAGANKIKACKYLVDTGSPFGNFEDQLKIPTANSGRMLLTYDNKEVEGTLVDCNGKPYHYHEKSFIHMEGTPYTMSQSAEFKKFLGGMIEYGYV